MLSHDRKESVEIVQIRHVALNARDVISDFPHSVVEISLSAPGDEDVGALGDEAPSGRKAFSTIAARDEGDLSFEFP